MKHLATVLALGISFNGICQGITKEHHHLVNSIINYSSRMSVFEDSDAAAYSVRFDDSISKYNKKLKSVLSSSEFAVLGDYEQQEICRKAEITILTSRAKDLKIFSWSAFNFTSDHRCSSIAVFKGHKPVVISFHSDDESDFGVNVELDSMIELKYSGQTYYILIGSNKCGNICIKEVASVYSALDGKLSKRSKVFFDGEHYLDDVEFNYILNDQIKPEPNFKIENREIISPVFDERRARLISTKKYKIEL
jgi:hypothetical protein